LEGGVRVPFVVSWPGHLKPGVFDQPVIQLDFPATALAAAGVQIDQAWKLDGVSLLPFLAGEKTGRPHDALYWRFGRQMAIRIGDYKLVRYDSNADTLTGARNQPVTAARLYNLVADIGETKDLAASMPDKVKELQSRWDTWNTGNVQPLWGGDQTGSNAGAPGAKKGKKAKGADSSR
jgi:arylsulfatase A-like enzyme